jgi:hypothetical protein
LFVDGSHAFGEEFGVFDFLKALVADFGKPELGGFCLGRRDGLDDAEKGFGIGGFDLPAFAVGGCHFKWGTICPPIGIQSGIALAELLNVVLDAHGSRKGLHDIDDGEHPFFLVGVPSATDLFFFE